MCGGGEDDGSHAYSDDDDDGLGETIVSDSEEDVIVTNAPPWLSAPLPSSENRAAAKSPSPTRSSPEPLSSREPNVSY